MLNCFCEQSKRRWLTALVFTLFPVWWMSYSERRHEADGFRCLGLFKWSSEGQTERCCSGSWPSTDSHFTAKYKGETLQKHRVLNILYTQGDFFSISINTQKASHALKLNAILRTRLKPEGINNIAPGWTEGLGILLIIFYCEHIFRHYYQKIIAQNYTPFSNWENNLYYNDFHKN